MKRIMGMIPTFQYNGMPKLNLADQDTCDVGLNLSGHLCLDSKQEAIMLHHGNFNNSFLPFGFFPHNGLQKKSPPHEPGGYGYECGPHPVIKWREELGSFDAVANTSDGNTAEKQRRGQMSQKFKELRSLIPNPTKKDRASIISDAAEYIKELLRTVEELKTLVRRKNCIGHKRKKTENGSEVSVDLGSSHNLKENCKLGHVRSSWLQRKSKETTVDVRIVEDEAYIKLTQRKKVTSLFNVAEILEELRLELFHLGFGIVGDYCTFMINTKIPENSALHASSIAERFIAA